jgi:hypothetical protein
MMGCMKEILERISSAAPSGRVSVSTRSWVKPQA